MAGHLQACHGHSLQVKHIGLAFASNLAMRTLRTFLSFLLLFISRSLALPSVSSPGLSLLNQTSSSAHNGELVFDDYVDLRLPSIRQDYPSFQPTLIKAQSVADRGMDARDYQYIYILGYAPRSDLIVETVKKNIQTPWTMLKTRPPKDDAERSRLITEMWSWEHRVSRLSLAFHVVSRAWGSATINNICISQYEAFEPPEAPNDQPYWLFMDIHKRYCWVSAHEKKFFQGTFPGSTIADNSTGIATS